MAATARQVGEHLGGQVLAGEFGSKAWSKRAWCPLCLRAEPQLDQKEMPRLAAHQCRALAHFRRREQAGVDGSAERRS
jgi:hypothetical protein